MPGQEQTDAFTMINTRAGRQRMIALLNECSVTPLAQLVHLIVTTYKLITFLQSVSIVVTFNSVKIKAEGQHKKTSARVTLC
jgi:hypothetical protein